MSNGLGVTFAWSPYDHIWTSRATHPKPDTSVAIPISVDQVCPVQIDQVGLTPAEVVERRPCHCSSLVPAVAAEDRSFQVLKSDVWTPEALKRRYTITGT